MKIVTARKFIADTAWGALDIERIDDASIRLHWTDQPYIWHQNDGPEVFVVLDGLVDMHVRGPEGEETHRLSPGDIFHAEAGDEHKAVPLGESRILVIERSGSI